MPISTIHVVQVAKAIKELHPAIKRLHLVGSRLRHREARDLDFVAVTDSPSFHGKNATLRVGGYSVNLFFAGKGDVESTILEFGLGLDIIRWKKKAISMGYHLNRYGLWKGQHLVTQKMAEISMILAMPLKPYLVYTLKHPY